MSNTTQDTCHGANAWDMFIACWYGKILVTSARLFLILAVAFLVAGFN